MNLEKLSVVDPELKGYIDAELNRQRDKRKHRYSRSNGGYGQRTDQ